MKTTVRRVLPVVLCLALVACGLRPGPNYEGASLATPVLGPAAGRAAGRRTSGQLGQPRAISLPMHPYYSQELDQFSVAGLSQYLDLREIALASASAQPGQEVEIKRVPLGAGKVRVFFTGSDGIRKRGFIRAIDPTSIALVAPVSQGSGSEAYQIVVSVRGKDSAPLPLTVSGLAPASQPLSTTTGQLESAFSREAAGTALSGLSSYLDSDGVAQAVSAAEAPSGAADASAQDTAERILESSGFTQALGSYLASHGGGGQSVQDLGCSSLPFDPLTKTSYSLADIRCGVPFFDAQVGQDQTQFQDVSEALQRAMAAAQSAGGDVLGQIAQASLNLTLAEASWQILLGAIPTQAASLSVDLECAESGPPCTFNWPSDAGEHQWQKATVQYSSPGSELDVDSLVASALAGLKIRDKAELEGSIESGLMAALGSLGPSEVLGPAQDSYELKPQAFPVDVDPDTTGFLLAPDRNAVPARTSGATPTVEVEGQGRFRIEAEGSVILRIVTTSLPGAQLFHDVGILVTNDQPVPTPTPAPPQVQHRIEIDWNAGNDSCDGPCGPGGIPFIGTAKLEVFAVPEVGYYDYMMQLQTDGQTCSSGWAWGDSLLYQDPVRGDVVSCGWVNITSIGVYQPFQGQFLPGMNGDWIRTSLASGATLSTTWTVQPTKIPIPAGYTANGPGGVLNFDFPN